METRKPTIEVIGTAAQHDQACAVCYGDNPEPAVYDIDTGVFQPSGKAQEWGWRLVKIDSWWKRLLFRIFSGE